MSCHAVHSAAYWLYIDTAVTATEAKADCAARGGHMPSIHSDAQNNKLVNFVLGEDPTVPDVWLGADDLATEVRLCLRMYSNEEVM